MKTPHLPSLPSVPFTDRTILPEAAGIYFALDADGEALYIGQAINLFARWRNHHRQRDLALNGCMRIAWVSAAQAELNELENHFIEFFAPTLNGKIEPIVIDATPGTVAYFWQLVRAAMRQQPRGYQSRMAEQLGVERSYISQFIKGEHELAPKYQQAVLDSVGLEMELTVRPAPARAEGEK